MSPHSPMNPMDEDARPENGTSYSARDLLTNPQVIVDSVLPMVLFVSANTLAGLPVAAAVSITFAGVAVIVRKFRGQRLLYSLGGLAGTGVAVGTALWSRNAGGFFGPGMVLNAGYAVGALVSIIIGRPFVAASSWLLYQWPWQWYRHPRVLPAYREITLPWAGLFGLRAWVRYRLISEQSVGVGDTALVLLTGWPAFAVLLLATYAYVNWRLRTLGAPDVEVFRSPQPPSASQTR